MAENLLRPFRLDWQRRQSMTSDGMWSEIYFAPDCTSPIHREQSIEDLDDAIRRLTERRDRKTKERDALEDIAYDCGSLEAAQRRAKEAL